MLDAFAKLITWKFDVHNVDPSGRIALQRRNGETWADVRGATVRDGKGVTFDLPHSDTTYRLLALTGSAATSEPLTIDVVQSDTDLAMARGGPATDGAIPIAIDWWHGASADISHPAGTSNEFRALG